MAEEVRGVRSRRVPRLEANLLVFSLFGRFHNARTRAPTRIPTLLYVPTTHTDARTYEHFDVIVVYDCMCECLWCVLLRAPLTHPTTSTITGFGRSVGSERTRFNSFDCWHSTWALLHYQIASWSPLPPPPSSPPPPPPRRRRRAVTFRPPSFYARRAPHGVIEPRFFLPFEGRYIFSTRSRDFFSSILDRFVLFLIKNYLLLIRLKVLIYNHISNCFYCGKRTPTYIPIMATVISVPANEGNLNSIRYYFDSKLMIHLCLWSSVLKLMVFLTICILIVFFFLFINIKCRLAMTSKKITGFSIIFRYITE